ncbi:AraC family transcriptional regulator [Aquimarina sp. 2201CG1-2-11]|uniref:helix-turn-helix domain-containing protein n=1 Tax=Aquimarina discodermiae TaxID=3231043 RepID=UPI003461F30E
MNTEAVKKFNIPDSLNEKSYKYLRKLFYKHEEVSPNIAHIYAQSYLKKSTLDNDSLKMAKGYGFLSNTSPDSLKIDYLDIAIRLSKNYANKYYPATFYYYKGDFYTDNANYKEALDNYFISYKMAKKYNNNILAYDSKFNIAALKDRIGKHEESLEIFKEFYNYIISDESEYPKDYYNNLIGLFALSDSYTKLQKLDTATTINKKGIKISLSNNDNDFYHYFIMNEGVNLYYKKDYINAIDSLNKVIPNLIKLEDTSNEIFTRFYLGKSYFENSEIENAVLQFKTVDSLFNNFKDLFPELREGYKILINHYKNSEDDKKQLFYLNRLISVDSVLNSNYQYINDKIVKDFDTPNLISKKEKLILKLNQSNSSKLKGIIFLIIGFIIVSIILVFNYRKRRIYKQKFEYLINQKANKQEKNKNEIDKKKLYSLPEEIVKTLEVGLKKFEDKKGYLNPNITVNTLAKKINSNSKYVSQFINYYKGKKFIHYINELRIDYIIEELKKDHKFRKYTIKAISEIAGFSNPISFSQAFYKKTGIKPSYFIKKLENNKKY